MYTIEKNVPVPADALAPSGAPRTKYPFGDMEIGDSFFVPGDKKLASTVTAAAQRTGHKYAYWTATRDDVSGTYVQRVEGSTPIKARKAKAADPVEAPAPALPELPTPVAVKPGRVAGK